MPAPNESWGTRSNAGRPLSANQEAGMAKRATKKHDVKQQLIDGLNKDLNLELEAVLRYLYHSASATGLLGHELREELKGDIVGEMNHAVFLADKIDAESQILSNAEISYQPTQPQLSIQVDRQRAADLNVPLDQISITLRAMVNGEDVIDIQGDQISAHGLKMSK